MRDHLDDLKAEVRQPLTDWENAEKERIEKHELAINEMSASGSYTLENWLELSPSIMMDRLKEIESIKADGFEEYSERAAEVKEAAVSRITKAIDKRETHEAEQAELEKLRLESAEREKKDREERIAKEAAENAKKEAEAKAKEEAEVAEKEKQKIIHEKEAAERKAKEAEENSKREAEAAATAERERIEQNLKDEEAAAVKREANKKHRTIINNKAVKALMSAGLTEEQSKKVVTAIAKKQIPGISIYY